jgi:hypothetical protein
MRCWLRSLIASIVVILAAVATMDGVNASDWGGHQSGSAAVTADQPGGGYLVRAQAGSQSDHASPVLNTQDNEVDSCHSCRWAVYPACALNSPDNPGNVLCTGATASCPPGQIRFAVMFMAAGATSWTGQPSICSDPTAAPPPIAAAAPIDIAGAVRDYLRTMPLPVPQPSFQPASGTLVNLPTIFDAGTVPTAPAGFDLAGRHITVTASPQRWSWTFEPGATQTVTKPGGRYPNTDVTYTYASTGTRSVMVTAAWGATYRVDGGAAQVVDATVSRTSAPLSVPVLQARSELVAGDGTG